MNEIDIDFTDFKIGHADDPEGGTGVTVIFNGEGMKAGASIAGGGPASRETPLLNELSAADKIHAVVLSGGSAFGLGAANGVMKYLQERGYGYETPYAKVPLVVQSSLYDLGVGDANAFPDAEMAYAACQEGDENQTHGLIPRMGNVGAGMGATVGKLLGDEYMMKSGIGHYAVQVGELKMGCIVAVNALGNVVDLKTRENLAGLLNSEKDQVISTRDLMFNSGATDFGDPFNPTNTTIGCLITNGKFSKAELNKIAQMGQDGLAMVIEPVHTTADGDTLYIVSDEQVEADLNLAGTLAAYVCAVAINRAVMNAESAYGAIAYEDLKSGEDSE